MGKGRKRTPVARLRLTGSAQKNAARLQLQGRGHEPQPDPRLGRAPRAMSMAQRAIWNELTAEAPPGVLTRADRLVLEITVRMTERVRNGTARASDYALLTRCLAQIGMTPDGRSKIQVSPDPKAKAVDEFSEFTATPGADKKPVN